MIYFAIFTFTFLYITFLYIVCLEKELYWIIVFFMINTIWILI